MAVKLIIPTSWNELNQKQFEKMAVFLTTAEPSLVRDIRLFKILVNAKWWQFILKGKLTYFLKQVPYSEWKKHLHFLLKENNRTVFEPIIKVQNKTYYAPMDRIQNLTADEFAVADDLHIRYRETKNIEFLQYLFHVLYQEQEQRVLFVKNNLPKLINKNIPVKTLLATELAYFGSKNHIVSKFKKAFPKSSKKSNGARTGFGKVIQKMAKDDLFKAPVIKQTNIYEFLTQFQDDIETIQKAKK